VIGLRTALFMWILAFAGRALPAVVPSPMLVIGLLLILASGGAAVMRLSRARVVDGALVGLVASAVNLLLLGSLLSGDRPGDVAPSALLWIPGFLAAGAMVGAIGGALGRALPAQAGDEPDWTGRLARVVAGATLALLAVGGLVTSRDAGLAVADWPRSGGYAMFLYPLSRMVGNVFYEHAHRLFGSFVGLATILLFVRIFATDRRRGARLLAGAALVLVMLQGTLGGLRVTGRFTSSTSPEDMRPSIGLAMVHGITGQLFFALVVAIAAVTSRTWKDAQRDGPTFGAPNADAVIALALIAVLLVQLTLGVHVRHAGRGLLMHIVGAAGVVMIGVLTGVRLLANADVSRVLRRTGAALLGHVGAQLVLGVSTFIVTGASLASGRTAAPAAADLASSPAPGGAAVLIPTLHQTVGALLLANAVLAFLWNRRLLGSRPES
jgi:cytochrome c oxidase assembly protein subunit 15